MNTLKKFIKNEIVFVVSLICAIISMFIVPPNKDYLEYINISVLIMLFCLMLVVAGLNSIGVFNIISQKLLSKVSNTKIISLILVNMCYILSMFITNDVALITIVPFTISVLKSCDIKTNIRIITMETISANLGSMITPIGNPQNIFIYEYYGLSIKDFFKIMLPLGILSLIVINIILVVSKSESINFTNSNTAKLSDRKSLILYIIMFLICILTVLKVFSHIVCLSLILILALIVNRKILFKVDYILLLTFVSFFIFVGNIGSIDVVHTFISKNLIGKEVEISVILSQIISNVPATLMLSPFTDNFKSLLIGVNLGGLGTLVGSLASLISFKIFSKEYRKHTKEYILTFSIYNFSILILLLVIVYVTNTQYLK